MFFALVYIIASTPKECPRQPAIFYFTSLVTKVIVLSQKLSFNFWAAFKLTLPDLHKSVGLQNREFVGC